MVHILFVLDIYSDKRGGVYSLQRGIISLIKCRYPRNKISCLTVQAPELTSTEFTQDDINFVYPDTEATLDDINSQSYFDKYVKGQLKNLTHVILFSSHTLKCALPGHLLEFLCDSDTSLHKDPLRAIIINNCELSKESEIRDVYRTIQRELQPRIIIYNFSLAEKYHSQSHEILENNGQYGAYSKQYYPYFEALKRKETPAPKLIKQVITFISNPSKYPVFLKKCAVSLSLASHHIYHKDSVDGSSGKVIWKIYFANEKDKQILLDRNDELGNVDLEIQFACISNLSADTIKEDLSTSSLAVIPGDFSLDMYSALEIFISGIPTYFLENTDLHQILHTLDHEKAKLFKLDNSDKFHCWEKTFRQALTQENKLLFESSLVFAAKYYNRLENHEEFLSHFEPEQGEQQFDNNAPQYSNSIDSNSPSETAVKTPYATPLEEPIIQNCDESDGPNQSESNSEHVRNERSSFELSERDVFNQLNKLCPSVSPTSPVFYNNIWPDPNMTFQQMPMLQLQNMNLCERNSHQKKGSLSDSDTYDDDDCVGPSVFNQHAMAVHTRPRLSASSSKNQASFTSRNAPKTSFTKKFDKMQKDTKKTKKKSSKRK